MRFFVSYMLMCEKVFFFSIFNYKFLAYKIAINKKFAQAI